MILCKITLKPLKSAAEKSSGYTKAGLAEWAGQDYISSRLPFDKDAFEHDLPAQTQGMSISGYQPKLQLVINDDQFDVFDSGGTHILKPSPKRFEHLAENEHATMVLMSRLGFEVPPCGLVEFPAVDDQTPEFAFVIKRFDRGDDGASIHQEQMDGAMGIGDKFGKTGTGDEQFVSYEKVGKFLADNVDNSLGAKIEFFRRVVYCYLLGNNDAHLRNFSLLYEGPVRLAPVYDFVSVAPYNDAFGTCYLALPLLELEEGGEQLAAGFDTQYGQYIGADFLAFGQGIGLNARVVKRLLSDIAKERSTVERTYRESFMPAEQIHQVLGCYQSRLEMLQVLEAVKV